MADFIDILFGKQLATKYSSTGGVHVPGEEGALIVSDGRGGIKSSSINEIELAASQINNGTFNLSNVISLTIDYTNKTIEKNGELASGNNNPFNRKRCIVDDAGQIVAMYGDNNYVEDGSLGQVMVYQPKFYYFNVPSEVTAAANATSINTHTILISHKQKAGFALHPIFYDKDGNELDYILFSAYEGCAYDVSENAYNLTDTQNVDFANDKLSSVSGAKPISGTNQQFNVSAAEQLASNRGEGWKITDLAFESMNQLLMICEFGSLNMQSAFNKGATDLPSRTGNPGCTTGSTSSLGNTSGMAISTTRVYGNTSETFNEEGKCSISYRGMENPYGNMWRFVGGVRVTGNGSEYGGKVVYTDIQNNVHTFENKFPVTSSWIASLAYSSEEPWALLPATTGGTANSISPVGDFFYTNSALNGTNAMVIGGITVSKDNAGIFYYGVDNGANVSAYSYSARLMYIPSIENQYYTSNKTKACPQGA